MLARGSWIPLVVALVCGPLACGGDTSGSPSGGAGGGDEPLAGTPIAADEQRPGDPGAGYAALVNEGYVHCGIPYSAYSKVFGAAPEEQRLPGRTGENAELPYSFNAFTTKS